MKKFLFPLFLFLVPVFLFSQVERKVMLEHYTNTLCGICASKNPEFYNLIDGYPEVLHIAYHPSSPYPACVFSQHNALENDARTNYYGIYGGTPRVVINGEVVAPGSSLLEEADLQAAIGKMTDYSLVHEHYFTESDSIEVRIRVTRENGDNPENLSLLVMLAEEIINYAAPNGEPVHHDVFRRIVLSETVSLGSAGDMIELSVKYKPANVWNQDEIYAISVLQNESDKSIVQAGRSGNAVSPSSVAEISDPGELYYPNPVTSKLYFTNKSRETFQTMELYNVFGKKILESKLSETLDVSGLKQGYYFILLKDGRGNIQTGKIVRSGI